MIGSLGKLRLKGVTPVAFKNKRPKIEQKKPENKILEELSTH